MLTGRNKHLFFWRLSPEVSGSLGMGPLPLCVLQNSVAADGHTHSVLTITRPSKIGACIVICSITKPGRRNTDRIMQFLHHTRFNKTKTLSHFESEHDGAFRTEFTLSGRWAHTPVHEQRTDWVAASCGCWLLSHFLDIFREAQAELSAPST